MKKQYSQFWRKVRERDKCRFSYPYEMDPNGESWKDKDYQGAYWHAKKLYLQGLSLQKIAEATGFSRRDINNFSARKHDNPGWFDEICIWQDMVMDKALEKESAKICDVLQEALNKLDTAVRNFEPDKRAVTANQIAAFATGVVAKVFEMNRLEENKPTSIHAGVTLTRQNLTEKFRKLKEMGIPVGIDLDALAVRTPGTVEDLDPEKIN